MKISLREIIDIYCSVIEGLKQQGRPGEFEDFLVHYPRDPRFIARGLEAAFGIDIHVTPVDFYEAAQIPDDRKDFFSFVEYNEDHSITVYLNTSRQSDGSPLLSRESARFAFLKECCTAAIRAAITKGLVQTAAVYPDTVQYQDVSVALLDWISERYPVYAFEDNEFAPTVTVENAAELLAIMLLVDISALYGARLEMGVRPKPIWGLPDVGEIEHDSSEAGSLFASFEYERYATEYGIKVRFLIVLVRTDFILKIVYTIQAFGRRLAPIFPDLFGDE
jgi:hypothetical protein